MNVVYIVETLSLQGGWPLNPLFGVFYLPFQVAVRRCGWSCLGGAWAQLQTQVVSLIFQLLGKHRIMTRSNQGPESRTTQSRIRNPWAHVQTMTVQKPEKAFEFQGGRKKRMAKALFRVTEEALVYPAFRPYVDVSFQGGVFGRSGGRLEEGAVCHEGQPSKRDPKRLRVQRIIDFFTNYRGYIKPWSLSNLRGESKATILSILKNIICQAAWWLPVPFCKHAGSSWHSPKTKKHQTQRKSQRPSKCVLEGTTTLLDFYTSWRGVTPKKGT